MIIKKASQAKKEGNILCIVYGPPGVGKTTLVETLPNPLLIDLERGFAVLKKDIDVAACDTWKDVTDALTAAVKGGYESVMIDSITRMIDLLTEEILKKNNLRILRIQDYGEIATKITRLVWDLKVKYKLNVVLVAHATEEADTDGGTTYTKPLLSPKSLGVKLPAAADLLAYMVAAKDGTRKLFVQPTDRFNAKNRIKALANPCKPDFGEILDAYKASINEMERTDDKNGDDLASTMAVDGDTSGRGVSAQGNGTPETDPNGITKEQSDELQKLVAKHFASPEARKEYAEMLVPFGATSAKSLTRDQVSTLIDNIRRAKEL